MGCVIAALLPKIPQSKISHLLDVNILVHNYTSLGSCVTLPAKYPFHEKVKQKCSNKGSSCIEVLCLKI